MYGDFEFGTGLDLFLKRRGAPVAAVTVLAEA